MSPNRPIKAFYEEEDKPQVEPWEEASKLFTDPEMLEEVPIEDKLEENYDNEDFEN